MVQDARPFEVHGDDMQVTGHSERRLPFEPRDWLKEYREELREHLQRLEPVPGRGLLATYAGPGRDLVDVENVLLHNVGSGAWSHLTREGVACRHLGDASIHVSDYNVAVLPDPHPAGSRRIGSIDAELPEHPLSAGSWWAQARRNLIPAVDHVESHAILSIDVLVSTADERPGLGSMVKPMLDGVVAALSSHDGSHRDRLEPLLRDTEPDAWSMLVDPSRAVLGSRTLVRPHRATMAWNPADERCLSFRIRREPVPSNTFAVTINAFG